VVQTVVDASADLPHSRAPSHPLEPEAAMKTIDLARTSAFAA
jgi:hypothetical protein